MGPDPRRLCGIAASLLLFQHFAVFRRLAFRLPGGKAVPTSSCVRGTSMRASLIATLAVALLASSPGFAADVDFTNKCTVPTDAQGKPECLCSVPFRVLQESPVALLNYIKGEVLKSDKAGFTPVTGSTTLQVGDTVLLKADAQAELTAGNCSHVVGPQPQFPGVGNPAVNRGDLNPSGCLIPARPRGRSRLAFGHPYRDLRQRPARCGRRVRGARSSGRASRAAPAASRSSEPWRGC